MLPWFALPLDRYYEYSPGHPHCNFEVANSWPRACAHQKTLGHGSSMTMIPHFMDETMEKSMDYNPSLLEGTSPLSVKTNSITHSIRPTFKSHPKKIPPNPCQHYLYLPYGIPCGFSSTEDAMDGGPN